MLALAFWIKVGLILLGIAGLIAVAPIILLMVAYSTSDEH